MEATALGVKNLFNTVSVDNLVVKETLQSQDVTVSGSMDTGTNTTIVASSLKPSETDVIHVGSPTHRFKRVYCDDFDVGVTHANKYLKTDASGVVGYETVHDPVTIGTANGLSLSGQVLSLSTATTAASGAMSQTDKVNHDSLVGNLFGSTINIGNTGVGVTNAINIGTGEGISTVNLGTGSGPTTINIGSTGDTINLQGTTVTVDTQNAQVTDAVLTLNKNGVNRNSVGIEILATDNSGPLGTPVEYVAAAMKTNGTGDTLEVKGVSGITKVNVGGQVTVDQSAGTTTCSKNVIMNTTDANVLSLKGTATNSVLKAQYEQSGTTYDILDVKAIGITSNRPILLRNLANTTQTSLWDDKIYNSTGALVLRGGGSSSTDAGLTVQNNFGVTTLEIKNDGTTSGSCDLIKRTKKFVWAFMFSGAPAVMNTVIGSAGVTETAYINDFGGSTINTPSQGRLSLPVTGWYRCAFHGHSENQLAGDYMVNLRANGVVGPHYIYNKNGSNTYTLVSGQFIVYYSAGTILDFYVINGSFYAAFSNNVSFELIRQA